MYQYKVLDTNQHKTQPIEDILKQAAEEGYRLVAILDHFSVMEREVVISTKSPD